MAPVGFRWLRRLKCDNLFYGFLSFSSREFLEQKRFFHRCNSLWVAAEKKINFCRVGRVTMLYLLTVLVEKHLDTIVM